MPSNTPCMLVVGGVVPGNRCVGEIALRDMCAVYPPERLVCLGLTDRMFDPALAPELAAATIETWPPPCKAAWRPSQGRIGTLVSLAVTQTRFRWHVGRLARRAARFAQQHQSQALFLVLDSALMIAVGVRVAKLVGLPVVSLVWDHPEYLLRKERVDRASRAMLMRSFAWILRRSDRVAVMSEPMRDEYAERFAAKPVIVRQRPGDAFCQAACCEERDDSQFYLAFAGGIYARTAWDAFLAAMHQLRWKVAGRRVVLRVFGSEVRLRSQVPVNIEYLGFQPEQEMARLLGECHAAYVPQPFEPDLYDLAHFSFPSKFSTYVAAERPVFIHAPEYASLVAFHRQLPVGVCCSSLQPHDIVDALKSLTDEANYVRACEQVRTAAATELSYETFVARTREFFGLSSS